MCVPHVSHVPFNDVPHKDVPHNDEDKDEDDVGDVCTTCNVAHIT